MDEGISTTELKVLTEQARDAVEGMIGSYETKIKLLNISWGVVALTAYFGGVAIGIALQQAKDKSL